MNQRNLTITLQPDWKAAIRVLLERTEGGGVSCPYTSMHIDMYLQAA